MSAHQQLSQPHPPLRTLAAEFLRALGDGFTYVPWRNPEVLFGFLWGLPIPVFTVAIHLHAAGLAFSAGNCAAVIAQNPSYIFFLAHPLLFAVIFGALGTMRSRRDQHIQSLLTELEVHCDELCNANTRLTELDRLKSEFLANVTHELKSPLVTALGYSDRILNQKLGPVTERQHHALEVSKRNLVRLRGLIEEILDFSRLEAGIGKFNFDETDLNAIFESAANDMSLKAKEKDIHIEKQLPPGTALVSGDVAKLTQACVNLLDNALKFSPGGKTLRISINAENGHWHVRIQDEGPGIAREDLEKLFQRFSQADGSASRPYNGVGLGLVIVKKIIDAHGGEVWLESSKGCGTTAHIRLPRLDKFESKREEVTNVTHTAG
jgi:signal transduction histidine kinase